ncbi:putative F-box/kelch-repeat protein SKIP6 [Iris pallida]|uniref:F-box/kelch-repeat protein SKIP6 n=1 Tax=Iris pallida TaxID=29817 RepID=A0AAX6HP80_IRIPA|nr:putative F-box/kelch-repeat protein SKIP6 [Iris pallida]
MDDDDQPLIPGLPDDISLRCIARAPISSNPTLSHVSRSWRSVLRSPFPFTLRSQLSIADPILTVSIRRPTTGQSLWYHLLPRLHHHRPLPIPPPPHPTVGSSSVPLGPRLFLLGGSLGVPCAHVQIYDSRLRRWSLGPPMSSPREFSAAAAVRGVIYAFGGCRPSAASWSESLDPAATLPRWSRVPSPHGVRQKWMHGTAVLGGKLLAVADRGGIVFDPAAASWGPVPPALVLGWRGRAAVVGEVLYTYDYLGKVRGYDWEKGEWRQVEGLERELPSFLCGATLANFGGLLCLVWEGRGKERGKETEISYAGVDLSRTEGGGIRGRVVWLECGVLKVPRGSSVSHCVTLEL